MCHSFDPKLTKLTGKMPLSPPPPPQQQKEMSNFINLSFFFSVFLVTSLKSKMVNHQMDFCRILTAYAALCLNILENEMK